MSSAAPYGGGPLSTRRFFFSVRIAKASSSNDGCDDHFGEHSDECVGQRCGHGAVEGNDAAERADRVTRVGVDVGVGDVVGHRHAARVGVLDDHARGTIETLHQTPRGLRVEQVEVAHLFATVLHRIVPPTPPPIDAITRAGLMRVLSIPQRLRPDRREVHRVGENGVVEPRGDLRVVRGDPGECIACQPAFGRGTDRPVGAQFVEHDAVVGGVDDNGDELVVLGGGAHHRRAADVDQVDARVAGKRIQVAHHQIDRLDPVFSHVVAVRRFGRDRRAGLRESSDEVSRRGGRESRARR